MQNVCKSPTPQSRSALHCGSKLSPHRGAAAGCAVVVVAAVVVGGTCEVADAGLHSAHALHIFQIHFDAHVFVPCVV